MSDNTFEEKNNSFRDYKTNSFDDGDLQTRLYAEIYYESNNQEELKPTNIPRMIQFDSICNELNIVPENVHKSEDKQHIESKDAREQLSYNDTLQVQSPIDSHVSVEILTCNDKSQEVNSMDDEYNSANNKSYSAIKGKENSVKKHKSSNYMKKKHQKSLQEDTTASLNDSVSEVIYSKYNIHQKSKKQEILLAKKDDKDKQTSDDSDSEVSIFEVPVPPKPKPLVIELQDSDEEIAELVHEYNLHQNVSKITNTRVTLAGNSELEVKETLSDQIISTKSKNTSKSQRNKNTVNVCETTQTTTHTQEVREDIVLNCSPVQKVASSISEIRQLSKDVEINQNQESTSMENTKHKKRTPQKTKKCSENNDNLQQDTHMISSKKKLQTKKIQQNVNINNTKRKVYNLRSKIHLPPLPNDMLVNICSDKNEATKAKRKCNSPIINNVKHKRQCTIQQNSQNVTLQDSNDKERAEGDKCFTPMSQEMRDYYDNSTRGHENFDISELQRNMSKDPKLWTILDEDLMPRPCNRQRTRFFNVRCSNCHQDGHQRYDCTVPRRVSCCHMCGTKGHIESRCSLKMCLTCGKKQNTYRKTCESCRVLYCTMCNSIGHKANQCPDLWRRYHQTTDMSNVPQDLGNTIKSPNLLYCCNCTKRGHESSTCKEYRWSQHFLTPATVTNYTDGPTYGPSNAAISSAIASECHHMMNISPSKAASNETSIPQNIVNTQQAMGEHSGLSANVNLSLLSEEANKMPISQEVIDIPQTEEIVKTNKISENQETEELIYTMNEKVFIDVFYHCGKFLHKNKKKSQIICQNLSMLATLSSYAKTTITNLEKRKVFPNFLKALMNKNIEFEVKIGITKCQRHKSLTLQLISLEESLQLIYELLLHWINLPNEEKDYGMDITLPRNSTKMYNLLSTRMPQFKKMGFTSYDNHLGESDPQQIFFQIKSKKEQLANCRKSILKKEYYRERTKLGRLQIKLLMIANTEPKPNKYVHIFQNEMKELELKQYQMSEALDVVTYLKFTLLYNILFVPHTPTYLFKMLHRFQKHAEKQKLFNNIQQELEGRINEQEDHALRTNMNLLLPPITPSTSQDINFVENLSAINIQQNANNNIINENEITNDILPINNTTNNDCDETMISDPALQIPQFIISFNTDSAIVPSKDFTSDINIESFASTSGQNAQSAMPQKQKSEGKKFQKQLAKFNKKNPSVDQQKKYLYNKALEVIAHARKFQLPHMENAADELQRKVNNQMLTFKQVFTMEKLIKLERKYQKDITSCCNSLKI